MRTEPSSPSDRAMGAASLPSAFMPDDDCADFQIGVCDEAFNVYARITMRGVAGVRRLETELAGLGYQAVTIGTSAQLHGCDMLVVRRPLEAGLALD